LKKVFLFTFSLIIVLILVFIGWAFIPEEQQVPPLQKRENSAIWKLERGFTISYVKVSPTSDKKPIPVIYLHGGPGGYIHSSIVQILSPLTEFGFEVFLYDQLGSGLSERPSQFRDVSLPHHVNDLHEIVTKQIGANKVILIGHSFGANLATHFLAAYPELVSKVVYSSPGGLSPIMYTESGQPERANIKIPSKYNFIEPWSYHDESDATLFQPKPLLAMVGALGFNNKFISDAEMDKVFNNLAAKFTKGMVCNPDSVKPEEGGAGMYAYMSANYNPDLEDIRPKLKNISIPSIILQGQCDSGDYRTVIEYSELLGSKYNFIEGAGHIIWWEKPEEYFNLIASFLNSKE
jgi:proline iminopeptidase